MILCSTGSAVAREAVCGAEDRRAEMRIQYEEDFGFVIGGNGKGI